MHIELHLSLLGELFLALPFLIIFIGIGVSLLKGKMNAKRFIELLLSAITVLMVTPYVVFIVMSISSKSLDNLKPVHIPPTKATAEVNKFYPWGITIKLENGRKYKTRVEDQVLMTQLLDEGAQISKRANSSDFFLFTENDTTCIPIKTSHIGVRNYEDI
ncbi:MAG: hypothetical protein K2M07_06640 [Muribaculaceae bacterium]|nr:hypothetical protein [Muribaculaceae bacterium]